MIASPDRSLIPPPECCTRCVNLRQWDSPAGVRHECINGHPMHPDCGWMWERKPRQEDDDATA